MSENIGSYEPDKGWSTEVVEKYNEGWVAGYAEAAGRITELEAENAQLKKVALFNKGEADRNHDRVTELEGALREIAEHPNAKFNVALVPFGKPTIRDIANAALTGGQTTGDGS